MPLSRYKGLLVFAHPGKCILLRSILWLVLAVVGAVDPLLLQPAEYPKYYLRRGFLGRVQHLYYELTAAAFAAPSDA